MTHARKQLRDAFVAALMGATAAGINVKSNRQRKANASACPMIIVRTPGDQRKGGVIHSSRLIDRAMTVDIDLYVVDDEAADDAIDALSAEVEQAVVDAGTMGLPLMNVIYEGCGIDFDDVGPGDVARARLRYTVQAFTSGPEFFLGV